MACPTWSRVWPFTTTGFKKNKLRVPRPSQSPVSQKSTSLGRTSRLALFTGTVCLGAGGHARTGHPSGNIPLGVPLGWPRGATRPQRPKHDSSWFDRDANRASKPTIFSECSRAYARIRLRSRMWVWLFPLSGWAVGVVAIPRLRGCVHGRGRFSCRCPLTPATHQAIPG